MESAKGLLCGYCQCLVFKCGFEIFVPLGPFRVARVFSDLSLGLFIFLYALEMLVLLKSFSLRKSSLPQLDPMTSFWDEMEWSFFSLFYNGGLASLCCVFPYLGYEGRHRRSSTVERVQVIELLHSLQILVAFSYNNYFKSLYDYSQI